MTEIYRVFVGIDVADSVLEQWYSALDSIGISPVLHQPHITLAFIGELSLAQIQALNQQLTKIQSTQFELTIKASGHFNLKKKQILWAGVDKHPALLKLQQQVVSSVQAIIPFKAEQDYIPHVSLVRHRVFAESELQQIKHTLANKAAMVSVKRFGLYRSTLTTSGAKYQLLHSYNWL